MGRKRSNGEGSVSFDKRRKRYRAKVTIGWDIDSKTGKSKQIIKTIGSNYKTQAEAQRALSAYLENPFDLKNKDITFENLYNKWFEDRVVKKSNSSLYRIKAAYKYCSSLYDMKFRDITILDMKDCIENGTALETRGKYRGKYKTASPSTKESIKYVFNHIYSYAIEAGIVDRNYAKEFSLEKDVFKEKELNRKIKKTFSEDEINKMWNNLYIVPYVDIILFGCYTGWRPIELVELKLENVNLQDNTIKGGTKTKAGTDRIVPIHHKIKDIVNKLYRQAKELNSKYLINDPTNIQGYNGLSYDQYLVRFRKVVELMEFDKSMTPHCTRHTFITMAQRSGVNQYIIKMFVGHDIKDITEYIYTHRTIEELQEAMDSIH